MGLIARPVRRDGKGLFCYYGPYKIRPDGKTFVKKNDDIFVNTRFRFLYMFLVSKDKIRWEVWKNLPTTKEKLVVLKKDQSK